MRKHRRNNPEKYKARGAVNNALQANKLKKFSCNSCSSGINVQAHHHDYSKPLEVEWLCKDCHNKEHGKLQYTLNSTT